MSHPLARKSSVRLKWTASVWLDDCCLISMSCGVIFILIKSLSEPSLAQIRFLRTAPAAPGPIVLDFLGGGACGASWKYRRILEACGFSGRKKAKSGKLSLPDPV
jgi:hypothetical protein